MIASLRGVVVLAVVAAALAILVMVIGPSRPATIDRRLWLGAEPRRMTVTHENERPVEIVKLGKGWSLDDPDLSGHFIPPDASTLDGILTALRARWHRTGSLHGRRHGSLVVDATKFEIGDPLAGTEQTWIYRDGRALLVDNWVARALVPTRLELRDRKPLANLRNVPSIDVVGIVHLYGTHRTEPTEMWLDPELVARFYDAAEAVELVSLDGTRTEPGFSFLFSNGSDGVRTLTRVGTCPNGRILISTFDGDGCVDAAAWNALESAARALTESAPDKRPLPFTPSKLTFGDGAIIDPKSHDFDRDRVRELVTALQTPGELVPRSGTPVGKLVADTVTLEIYKDGVARDGEPMMIRTPLIDVIRRPSSAYRDTTRWREDVLTIQSITVDGKTFKRGAVIGEWIGASQPGRVEALAGTLATVRAPDAEKAGRAKHHIAVTFAPPTGQPTTHTIEIGDGCTGRIDGNPAMVPADLCSAVDGLQ